MSIQDIAGKVYENFFMRDLTYIFGGFLILISVNYSFEVDVFGYLVGYLKIEEMEWFKLIIVFIVSYFVGKGGIHLIRQNRRNKKPSKTLV
ncbi:MAG: hypothetical protein JSW60_04345 [Thermoplasmatales archaeon]|nr:MAG: hypothetical protein JSW60_04345 [Thermoplasmatales archaeon]